MQSGGGHVMMQVSVLVKVAETCQGMLLLLYPLIN